MSSRPGKTAPRLLQDLLTYDPRYEERAGRHLLTTSPPHFDPKGPREPAVPGRNCRHAFMTKNEQSVLPTAGEDPDHQSVYKIASFCKECRWHVDLLVDFRDDGSKTEPCRKGNDFAIHHFIYQGEDTPYNGAPSGRLVPRTYRFSCSGRNCPVELKIRITPPRFTDDDIPLLTDKQILRKRLETARQLGGDRADAQMARPVDALDYLNTYLGDALNPQKGKNRIPLLNRKFLKTFGKDCHELLTRLGFTYNEEPQEDGAVIEVYYLPNPPPSTSPLDHNTQRTLIEDARYELNVCILQIPENERTSSRHPGILPQPSSTDMQRALGCLDYERKFGMTRAQVQAGHEEDHPYYAGLGTVGDFADSLLLFAFSQQCYVDQANSPYYFECLQNIAKGRKSEALEMHVALLASKGLVNREELDLAYRFLSLDPHHALHLSDDIIIDQFRARLQDIGPSAVEETRNKLRIIGHARQSDRIIQEASDAIETYEQALSWLGLTADQPDEFVVTMYSLKVSDNVADRVTANKAVEKIAEYRNSQRLRDYLKSGVLGDTEMDTAEAYALLSISNRAVKLDLDMLHTQMQSFADSNPTSQKKYERAFELVRKDQQENPKQSDSGEADVPAPDYPLDSWPVGCKNIGNTCYLNSVLQFLFTIKPLREMVIKCDEKLQETTPEALLNKRVGREAVTQEKVKEAQEFVQELWGLFQQMITASTYTVRPKENLAALALAKASATSLQSTSNPTTDVGLGNIGGAPIVGPMPNPGATSKHSTVDDLEMKTAKSDTSSTVAEDGDHIMGEAGSINVDDPKLAKPEPPSRPPPIPPRPQASAVAESTMKKIEFDASQQDAAEILNNVFDLLSCAFKGEGVMDDGEQYDFIKRLFFSAVTSITLQKGEELRNKELQNNHLVSPNKRDRPLYAALDDEFSKTEVDEDTSQTDADGDTTTNRDKTVRYAFMEDASPVQIINVRRLIFEDNKPKKDDSHLQLTPEIFFDRYMKKTKTRAETELAALREQQWGLQSQLKRMENRKARLTDTELKSSLPEIVEEGAEMVEDINKTVSDQLIDVDDPDVLPAYPDLAEHMRLQANHLQKEIDILLQKMKHIDQQIASLWTDCEDVPYRLHAIFMHRGSATGGHYWIYIHDFQQNIWRKYNDERVSKVENVDEIFKQEEKYPATSTGIVYVRADALTDITEAVCRAPEVQPEDRMDVDGVELQVINGVADSIMECEQGQAEPEIGRRAIFDDIEKATLASIDQERELHEWLCS